MPSKYLSAPSGVYDIIASVAGTLSIRARVSFKKQRYNSVASSTARKEWSLVFALPGWGAFAATASACRIIGLCTAPSYDLIKSYAVVFHRLLRRSEEH